MSTLAPASPALRTVEAEPYRWPFDGAFDPARTALVACLDPTWRVDGPPADASDGCTERLATALCGAGALLVAVRGAPRRRGEPCHSRAADPLGGFSPLAVAAGGACGFFESPLDSLLRRERRSDLILCGWGLEGPVHSTMRAANDRGYECLLVSDASVPGDDSLAPPALSMVCFSGGIFGAVARTDSVLAALGAQKESPFHG